MDLADFPTLTDLALLREWVRAFSLPGSVQLPKIRLELIRRGLVEKRGSVHSLTEKGRETYLASRKTGGAP